MDKNSRMVALVIAVTSLAMPSIVCADETTEFCLQGEFDLGARNQGLRPEAGEWYPMSWCVITEGPDGRVQFSGSGKSNPDMDGDWTVAYLPPNLVRIVNRESPPDVEFGNASMSDEIKRIRRLDPKRLADEVSVSGQIADMNVIFESARVTRVSTQAVVPLRGKVDVEWLWDWTDAEAPKARLEIDGTPLLKATGRWRSLTADEARSVWQRTPGESPIQADGDRWPSTINMRRIDLDEGVYLVRGVRTGFQHLVVDTSAGLVVGDAPTGWLEFHHLPPADLAPGLGTDGLSELLIGFLEKESAGRPVHAVVLTHAHDDHAGGAAAFASAGASVYAGSELKAFFDNAMNVNVVPVESAAIIGSDDNRVQVMSLGPGPHAASMLGVWAMDKGWFFVSDIHVPRSDAPEPRAGREATECWFANWAVTNLPDETVVVNSHSPVETPVSRLQAYLDSPGCELRDASAR